MISNFAQKIIDHAPTILTSLSAVGVVSTAVLAVKATPQAHRDILDANSEFGRPLELSEKFKLTWHYYIPAAAVGIVTIGCIVSLHTTSQRRQAAMASVYSVTERAFREYRDKVEETLGETKEQEIRDDIAEDKIKENPPQESNIIVTGDGEHLMYDELSGRYFRSTIEKVRQAQNSINADVINDMYASLNDFYRLIGLSINGYGEEVGWSTDNMLDIHFSAQVSENSEPAIVLMYDREPIRGYYRVHR